MLNNLHSFTPPSNTFLRNQTVEISHNGWKTSRIHEFSWFNFPSSNKHATNRNFCGWGAKDLKACLPWPELSGSWTKTKRLGAIPCFPESEIWITHGICVHINFLSWYLVGFIQLFGPKIAHIPIRNTTVMYIEQETLPLKISLDISKSYSSTSIPRRSEALPDLTTSPPRWRSCATRLRSEPLTCPKHLGRDHGVWENAFNKTDILNSKCCIHDESIFIRSIWSIYSNSILSYFFWIVRYTLHYVFFLPSSSFPNRCRHIHRILDILGVHHVRFWCQRYSFLGSSPCVGWCHYHPPGHV